MGAARCRELVNGTRVISRSIRQAQAGGGTEHSAAANNPSPFLSATTRRNIPNYLAPFCHLFFLRLNC